MKRMDTKKNASFLHIVPTKGRVMELETDSRFWVNRRVNTLTGVIHQIFNEDIKPEKYSDYSHIDRILSQLLIKKALINRSAEAQGLSYFNSLFSGDNLERDYPGIFTFSPVKSNYRDNKISSNCCYRVLPYLGMSNK